jgi:eukaryotic-like serine/threonine-protein kinase
MPGTEQRVALPTRYRVLRLIARGGMASVWAAEDEVLGRLVAVKVLSPALDADERAHRRFLREARAAARLGDCRHVVTVYDIGEHEGRSFIVMEHFAGGTLADRLRGDHEIPRPVAMRWLREAATALDCAHDHGVVHRDVKPANLLLDDHGRLAVADFGIATVATEASVTLTGQVLGTAAYIAPEQARGHPATAASDRYALAVVAYELLTGRRPFAAEGAAAQARAHVEATVPDASAADAGLPAAVGAALRDGMAKEPEDRPGTAGALVDRLEAALGEPADTVPEPDPTEVTRRLAPVAAPPRRRGPDPWAPAPAPTPVPAAARRRRVAPIAALCALALVAGAVAAIALSGRGGGDDDARTAAGTTATAGSGDEQGATATSASSESREATTTQAGTGTGQSTPTASTATTAPGTQSAPAAGDPKALNDQGFALLQRGDALAAVPLLQGSVDGFRGAGRTGEIDYAFALYNLGTALRRSGRPAEAIPLLEERLRVSNFKRGTVRKALAAARSEAGGGG